MSFALLHDGDTYLQTSQTSSDSDDRTYVLLLPTVPSPQVSERSTKGRPNSRKVRSAKNVKKAHKRFSRSSVDLDSVGNKSASVSFKNTSQLLPPEDSTDPHEIPTLYLMPIQSD